MRFAIRSRLGCLADVHKLFKAKNEHGLYAIDITVSEVDNPSMTPITANAGQTSIFYDDGLHYQWSVYLQRIDNPKQTRYFVCFWCERSVVVASGN